jgi:glycosyltransferase involved in cell wall biosynthesis
LWGTDAFSPIDHLNDNLIEFNEFGMFSKFDQILSRYIFNRHSTFSRELTIFFHSLKSCNFYSVQGPCSLKLHLAKTNLFAWVFRAPIGKQSILSPFHPSSLRKHSGFLCLTPNAEKFFSQYAPSKFIPWCVDLDMFNGKPPREKPVKDFFLATGKTGRDYHTLIDAAYRTEAEIRIIGPKHQKPFVIPENVRWIDSSKNPPDQAIDYLTLKEWYAQCIAVCIPLSGDADDTCGYTNMLEGMAMRKPVIMTRSGCLHIDPASRNFGILVEPRDSNGWSDAMNHIINDQSFALKCGEKGRKIVEDEFSIKRFNRDVLSFINEIIELNGRN